MRNIYILFLLLNIISNSNAQEVRTIHLKQQKVSFRPNAYYISAVVDDRPDTTNIGTMRGGITNKRVKINLQNGVAEALERFIRTNVTQDETATPIALHIIQMEVSEKSLGMKEEADLVITFGFYKDNIKLVEFSGSGYIQAGLDVSPYIETLVRQQLENGLKEFGNWWSANRSAANAAPGIKVEVTVTKESDNPEMMAYDGKRLLSIADFNGAPDDMSMGTAATNSAVSMGYSTQTQFRNTTVKVTIGAFFDKSRSWFKPSVYNSIVLAHEQLHFDITALKVCELAALLKVHTFDAGNYGKELEAMQRQTQKEIDQMQQRYDNETKHGTILSKQQEWSRMIHEELSKQTCY